MSSRGFNRGFGRPRPFRGGYQQRPQYYEESEEQQFTPKPKGSKKVRDDKRRDQYRERVNIEAKDDIKKELGKTLFFGFTMDTKAFEGQRIGTVPQAKVLPISTRTVGLTLQGVFVKLNQTMNNIPACSDHEAYRVSLAQMEFKVAESG